MYHFLYIIFIIFYDFPEHLALTKAKVITQSGHVVLVSGLVLTIAYGSMLCLPGSVFLEKIRWASWHADFFPPGRCF